MSDTTIKNVLQNTGTGGTTTSLQTFSITERFNVSCNLPGNFLSEYRITICQAASNKKGF